MTCKPEFHALFITYTRPWRNLFFKVRHVRCFHCDLHISEPLFLHEPPPVAAMYVMGRPPR